MASASWKVLGSSCPASIRKFLGMDKANSQVTCTPVLVSPNIGSVHSMPAQGSEQVRSFAHNSLVNIAFLSSFPACHSTLHACKYTHACVHGSMYVPTSHPTHPHKRARAHQPGAGSTPLARVGKDEGAWGGVAAAGGAGASFAGAALADAAMALQLPLWSGQALRWQSWLQ